MTELEILPVKGIGDVTPGTDLAAAIAQAAPWLRDGDVVVVTSKVVSKAEGRLVEVPPDGPGRDTARDAAITAETARAVATRGPTRIVQTHHGFVLASAGIDASNVDSSHLVLLPEDPDASARALRTALRERHGRDVAVVVTDTMGRPWRVGLVDVAIGAAGIDALADYRGTVDPYGNPLQLTQMAVVDELAAAAELVKGKTDGVPVAVVRGLAIRHDHGTGAAALVREAHLDLFSLGTAEARALGRHEAATLPDAGAFAEGEVDPHVVDTAIAAVGARFVRVADPGGRDKLRDLTPPNTAEIVVPAAAPDVWSAARAGAAVHRLRAELAAHDLATAWGAADPETLTALAPPPDGEVPLGLLAIGRPGA